ncbi:hypothetical protein [Tsukamurella hominis]|uniref:hypothetical protein n=1 Tax=Tsukamurella hominis TaxID=1970232 RepID=UPI0039EBED66
MLHPLNKADAAPTAIPARRIDPLTVRRVREARSLLMVSIMPTTTASAADKVWRKPNSQAVRFAPHELEAEVIPVIDAAAIGAAVSVLLLGVADLLATLPGSFSAVALSMVSGVGLLEYAGADLAGAAGPVGGVARLVGRGDGGEGRSLPAAQRSHRWRRRCRRHRCRCGRGRG